MSPENQANNNKQSVWRKPYLWVLLGVLLGALAFWLVGSRWGQQLGIAPSAPPAAMQPSVLADDNRLLVQRARNQTLEEEIKRLEEALRDDPCKILRMLEERDPRNTPLAPGVLPENKPDGQDSSLNGLPSIARPATPANVGELLEQTTVFVLVENSPTQVGQGSGFFVAPEIVATNAHVAGRLGNKVIVGNPAMGGMRPGQVIAISADENYDFALIKVPGTANIPYLRIGNSASRTMRVSAWGFPAFITGDDPKLKRLVEGDISAAPEVVYSEGAVSVVLEHKPPMIVHSAALSQGNSGGPLVDDKGIVVGINTLITKASQSYSQSSVALPGSELAAFMQKHGVAATRADK